MNDSVPSNQLVLHKYSEDAYLQYALAVVKDRALARVEDGAKPVQRRILYAMRQLGLTADAKPVKSARIVGDVLGKYHPHGDTASYAAMVRMAQSFSLRYPLVLKQGNFGSRDGDPPAAMRYTEARLSLISELLLSEIGQGTVDFMPNYDGSLQEPRLLPARLPFLLLNGTMGIAVGMASDIPPHNIKEVALAATAYIENPEISTAELLEILPGPDFPGGAQLISSRADVLAAYEGGRGTLRVRARWRKEELARGQYNVIVYELPYQVSGKMILEQLDVLTNPQPPAGKKCITQQQANLKQIALDLLEKATDESGKDAEVRLVLSPRTSKIDPAAMMSFLFSNTSLEDTVSVNMTLIGLDERPQTKGLKALLGEWVTFRFETVRRRTKYNLARTLERIHILDGRMTVYLNLDAVIKIIRDAEEPREGLMEGFAMSEIQAMDILDMRLRQLNKLEGVKLERELAELQKEASRLDALLQSAPAMRKLIIKEIGEDSTRFADDRRTLIKVEAKAGGASTLARIVADEEVTIIISKNLWVRARAGHEVDESTLGYKAGDEKFSVIKTRSLWPVVFLDSLGRSYSVPVSELSVSRGDGVPLTTIIDIQDGARIQFVLSTNPEQNYLFSGQSGYGFTAPLQSLVASRKAGKSFLSLKPSEEPLPPLQLPSLSDGILVIGAAGGRVLAFPVSEVKSLPKGGQGVTLMALEEGDLISSTAYAEKAPVTLEMVGGSQLTLKGTEWAKYFAKRARKGSPLPKKLVMR
jgi:topoisomerase-4 subunit A